jgi:hypothetical protein
VTSILHLHHPIKRGEDILFEVIRTWPGKCLPLLRGDTETFSFCASPLGIQHVEYSVVLPNGFDAVYELIDTGDPDIPISTNLEYDKEGRRMFAWSADKVPAKVQLGMRLELK